MRNEITRGALDFRVFDVDPTPMQTYCFCLPLNAPGNAINGIARQSLDVNRLHFISDPQYDDVTIIGYPLGLYP